MSVDLELPLTSSPDIDPYKDIAEDLSPIALYTLVELSSDELDEVEQICNRQPETEAVRRAANYDFHGQALKAAWSEHLYNTVPTRKFGFFYFVAIVDTDWREKGVLVVTLNDWRDEEVCYNDKLRVPVEDAGLMLVNLQIANSDWDEYKEEYGEEADGDED